MRKIQLLGLAVIAVFAFSALGAASAFAESEFLLNNNLITENVLVEGTGELTLVTKKVPLLGTVEVLCTGVLHGEILGADPKHVLIFEVLDLEGHVLGTLGGANETSASCVNVKGCPTPLLWPDNLPWLGQIELMGGVTFLLDLTEDEEEPKGLPGYHVECMGSIALTNLCTGLVGFNLSNGATNVLTNLTVVEQEKEGEVGTCETGEGFVATDEGSVISTPSGNLSVS